MADKLKCPHCERIVQVQKHDVPRLELHEREVNMSCTGAGMPVREAKRLNAKKYKQKSK